VKHPPCNGKVGFDSFDLAAAAGRRARAKHKRVNPYHCPECKKFHTGNNDGRTKRPPRTIGVEE
jgi:hypothetical protein